MRFLERERLLNLCQRHSGDPLSSDLSQALLDMRDGVTLAPLPFDHVFRIYRIRARGNNRRSGSVIGFDHLIPRLENAHVTHIVISKVDIPGGALHAFTDQQISILYGILKTKSKQDKSNVIET